ncbi:hypothetical protein EV359DRAFT_45787 [Lentinula novae-zelandiae]|nr:hypothetical protein EV359DRAFT_45787 [Lentinula novae-zelandiae]
MPTTAEALLFVYAECGQSITEEQFNNWYDNEHAPLRITVPGFLTAARYKALDTPPKAFPKWLALYDLTSQEVMYSHEYKDLRLKASDNERRVIGNLETLNRRVYELVNSSDISEVSETESDKAAKFLYVVHMQVVENGQDESRYKTQEDHLVQWYTSTRIPQLALAPGYIRSRVFRLTEHAELAGRAAKKVKPQSPSTLLAIHEWRVDGAKVINSLEFKMCMTDTEPWKMEGEEAVAVMEDRMFELYKVFLG